jgi:3'-5' exoribonuclease
MPACPARKVEQMELELRELVATVQSPHLRRLLLAIFGERSATWRRYREAPAAKHYHQAYRHGLLEHSLTVAQAVSAMSGVFPGIDRDLAVSGALLHDIGKLDSYRFTPPGEGAAAGDAMEHGERESIEMSDLGRLHGEIALGYHRVREEIERLEGFPEPLAHALLHIILSHHGSHEHGSPVVPCTREATLVHMVDNLGSRLGSFDRIERALPDGERWAGWDKGIGTVAYFAPLGRQEPKAAA